MAFPLTHLASLAPDPQALSWLVLALLGACAVALWVAVARLGEIEKRLAALVRGEGSLAAPQREGQARENIDLRRVEQALHEIRDNAVRLEDTLLRAAAHARGPGTALEPFGAAPIDLGERVTNRLLALGFERIVIVTPRAQFETIFQGGGEVLVEARRDGAPCKGKVSFRGGALVDVAMQSAYATFP